MYFNATERTLDHIQSLSIAINVLGGMSIYIYIFFCILKKYTSWTWNWDAITPKRTTNKFDEFLKSACIKKIKAMLNSP